jgi:hypothetical protein
MAVVIDRRMMNNGDDLKLLFHPMSNDYTTEISAKELDTFLKATGHKVQLMDFPIKQ